MKYINLFILLFFSLSLSSQRLLLIETINDPQTIKLAEGQSFEYKIYDSQEWLKGKINKLMVEDSVILFNDGLLHISQISHIRRYRKSADLIGKGLMTFGVGWFTFGGLGALSGNYEFGTDTFVIGGTALIVGWAVRKLFYKRTLVIGERYRLRLIDLSLD